MRTSEARKASYFLASYTQTRGSQSLASEAELSVWSFYLLDELLVLVKLLQVINRHVLELDKLGTIDIGSISENADRHARSGDVGEPNQIIFRLVSAP